MAHLRARLALLTLVYVETQTGLGGMDAVTGLTVA